MPGLEDEIAAAAKLLRGSSGGALPQLVAALPEAPSCPQDWLTLLRRFPISRKSARRLHRMAARLAAAGWPAGTLERFALSQSFLAVLPQLPELPADPSVKRLFCGACLQVATVDKRWAKQFDLASKAFAEMAEIATLHRLPAGQLSFDRTSLPRSWWLAVHPLDLPDLLREVFRGLGGHGPLLSPHTSHWRPNPLVLLPQENERSLWRIAKSMQLQPDIRGLMADSWMYSADVGESFPHLAWLRDFFVEQGAYAVDLELADPGSGFLIGSARRRQLYENKAFRPRHTLVLWRRADMLAWAARHPELGEAGSMPAPAGSMPCLAAKRRPDRRHGSLGRLLPPSGRWTLVDAKAWLARRPKLYILSTLLAPSMGTALAAASLDRWLALPAFFLSLIVMWLFQYFFLQ